MTNKTELDISYHWVLSHYDNIIAQEKRIRTGAYKACILSSIVGFGVCIVAAYLFSLKFPSSFYIVGLLAVILSTIFVGKKLSEENISIWSKRKFAPKAVSYIPIVYDKIVSPFGKMLSSKISSGDIVDMSEIVRFVNEEKAAHGLDLNKTVDHMSPPEFITAKKR